MSPRRALLLLPVLLPLLGACATPGSFVRPEVSLVGIRLTDVTLLETTAVFRLRVQNENPRPLVLDGGVYELSLNGASVGRGYDHSRIEIPRYQSGETEVMVHLRNGALVRRLSSILAGGGADYRIDARHYVHTGFGRREIFSVSEGSFGRVSRHRG